MLLDKGIFKTVLKKKKRSYHTVGVWGNTAITSLGRDCEGCGTPPPSASPLCAHGPEWSHAQLSCDSVTRQNIFSNLLRRRHSRQGLGPHLRKLAGSGTFCLGWRLVGPQLTERGKKLLITNYTAVGAWRSFPSRVTRSAYEIMFPLMALRAKSGNGLQQLNGFSRMHGPWKKSSSG